MKNEYKYELLSAEKRFIHRNGHLKKYFCVLTIQKTFTFKLEAYKLFIVFIYFFIYYLDTYSYYRSNTKTDLPAHVTC